MRSLVKHDGNGNFAFEGVESSTYVVRIAGLLTTTSFSDADDDLDIPLPPPSSTKGISAQKIVYVHDGEDYRGIDFGYYRLEEDVYSMLFFASSDDDYGKLNVDLLDTLPLRTRFWNDGLYNKRK